MTIYWPNVVLLVAVVLFGIYAAIVGGKSGTGGRGF
jgi:hypothetical protein